MEEQFILRVPPSVAERIEQLLTENDSSSEEKLDLSFSDDGRTGNFVIGNDSFSATLLDLPSIVESFKTYDENVLIKTADIGQVVIVSEDDDNVQDVEYRHGLTPPMRDARKRRFYREKDLNPDLLNRAEIVSQAEKELTHIMAGGRTESRVVEQEENGDGNAQMVNTKEVVEREDKPDRQEAVPMEPERTDTEESDYSI